ncbi:MAG: nuclear transport factor 2 family protein [Saprospiraceae bacterium]|nr:nuclear transport factor 2 family protein [Saprospiraceae bacterium]
MKYILLLILAISLTTGYGQKMSNSRSVKDKAAIEKQQQETLFKSLVRDMMDAYNEGRYLQVAQYYHDDAIVSGGTTFVEGRDALDQYWEDFFPSVASGNSPSIGNAITPTTWYKGVNLSSYSETVKRVRLNFSCIGARSMENGKFPRTFIGKIKAWPALAGG